RVDLPVPAPWQPHSRAGWFDDQTRNIPRSCGQTSRLRLVIRLGIEDQRIQLQYGTILVAYQIHALTQPAHPCPSLAATSGGGAKANVVPWPSRRTGIKDRQENFTIRAAADNHVRGAPQEIARPGRSAELNQLDAFHRYPVIFAGAGQNLEERH